MGVLDYMGHISLFQDSHHHHGAIIMGPVASTFCHDVFYTMPAGSWTSSMPDAMDLT